MTRELPPHIWFVRSNGGSGSYPVRPEGRRAVWFFVVGLAASAVLAVVLAAVGPIWLWGLVFVVGVVFSVWRFIDTARKHTDYSLTYNDYVKDKKNA
jgi:hypothetical protein